MKKQKPEKLYKYVVDYVVEILYSKVVKATSKKEAIKMTKKMCEKDFCKETRCRSDKEAWDFDEDLHSKYDLGE